MKFLASVCAFIALTPACLAASGDPYVGLDLDVGQVIWSSSASAVSYPTNPSGMSLRLGDRIFKNIAVEIGYSENDGYSPQTIDNTTGAKQSNRLALRSLALDSLAYLPLGGDWFQPFATAGLGYDEANARVRIVTTVYDAKTGLDELQTASTRLFASKELDWRAGFGMEFVPTDGLSARVTFRYESYTFAKHMSGGTVIGIGLNAGL